MAAVRRGVDDVKAAYNGFGARNRCPLGIGLRAVNNRRDKGCILWVALRSTLIFCLYVFHIRTMYYDLCMRAGNSISRGQGPVFYRCSLVRNSRYAIKITASPIRRSLVTSKATYPILQR